MYSYQTRQIMEMVLSRNSNCVDVGCHLGSVLRQILKFAPEGNHFAFEPIPEFAEILTGKYSTVQIYEAALSDSSGESSFCHVVGDPGYSGLMKHNYPRGELEVKNITVKTAKMDELIPKEIKINFIKVDVEGAELQVFKGAVQTIRKSKPVIIFEHGGFARSFGTKPEMVYELLVNQCGLRLSLLSDWLEGNSHLTQEEFAAEVDSHYYFIAHPCKTGD